MLNDFTTLWSLVVIKISLDFTYHWTEIVGKGLGKEGPWPGSEVFPLSLHLIRFSVEEGVEGEERDRNLLQLVTVECSISGFYFGLGSTFGLPVGGVCVISLRCC